MLVATSPLEMERMRALWDRTAANGLQREWLSAGELREREPNIPGSAGSLSFQRHRQLPRSGGGNGEELRSERRNDCLQRRSQRPERTCQRRGDPHPPGGEYEASTLIACSGLMADRLVKCSASTRVYHLSVPREYFQLAPQHNQIVNHLIYPIPIRRCRSSASI